MWPWDEGFEASRAVFGWSLVLAFTPTSGGPRGHPIPRRHNQDPEPGCCLALRSRSVAFIVITVTAIIIAPHHLQGADTGLPILLVCVLLVRVLLGMV